MYIQNLPNEVLLYALKSHKAAGVLTKDIGERRNCVVGL